MTKTAATSTLSPDLFALGQDVLAEQIREIVRAQNWVFEKRWECHVSQTSDDDGWDTYTNSAHTGSGLAIGTQRAGLGGPILPMYHVDAWITIDAALNTNLICGAECACDAANGAQITFTATGSLGSASAVVNPAFADNQTELTDNIDLSSITNGEEWIDIIIYAQQTSGAGSVFLRTVRIEEEVISSLPDPADCDVVDSGDPVVDGGVQVTACT